MSMWKGVRENNSPAQIPFIVFPPRVLYKTFSRSHLTYFSFYETLLIMASSKEFITITSHSQYLIIALTISLPLLTFFIDMQIQHDRNQSEPPIQKPATLPKDFVKLPSGKNSSQFIPTAKPRPSSG